MDLPELAAAMVGWQPLVHQPNSVAAAVICYDTLADAVGQRWTVAAPVGVGGFSRIGRTVTGSRPLVDALVAAAAESEVAAAEAEDETGTEASPVVAMSNYLARRSTLSRRVKAHGSTPFGPGYYPLAGLRYR